MITVFSKIEDISRRWGEINLSTFLNISFLKIYCQNHKQIKHLFFLDSNMRLYAHIFNITFNKTKNYLQKKSMLNIFLNVINFDVLYLTNSFITNVPSFETSKKINLEELLLTIKKNYSIIVIPDSLYENLNIKKEVDNYSKIEVEEEMILDINIEWDTLSDYMLDLKKKYRNKVKNIIKKTEKLNIVKFCALDLEKYSFEIKALFKQVSETSKFKGPAFNTDSFIPLVKQGFVQVNGVFIKDKLVGFSSEIQIEKKIYAYFVGFDKHLNKSIPIYGRILLENISTAIKLKKKQLILGRTANEYKSNFGATPVRSFVYLKVRNKLMRTILRPIYSQIKIKEWIQRNPFK